MLDSLRSSSRMSAPAFSTHRVQFGVFELDLQHAELRKQGVKIKLQEQPLKLLQVLLENPGQIVSREDLRERIWPANTFVEFDQGLYSAIARLRDALGDSSENPVFIETVARRGYRFVALVRVPESVAPTAQTTRNPAMAMRRFALSLLAGLLGGALLIGALLIFRRCWNSSLVGGPPQPPHNTEALDGFCRAGGIPGDITGRQDGSFYF